MRRTDHLFRIGILPLLIGAVAAAAAAEPIDFDSQIRPILENRCTSCHGSENQKSGLRLDHKEAAMLGGDYGKAIVPGDSAASPLYLAVAGLDPDLEMPPSGDRLPAEEIELLKQWIDQGADWPEAEAEVAVPKADHWAFQPVVRPEVPEVADADWVRNPIDAFILEKLEAEGVEPSRPADRWTLIRRLSLDLTGLPPTPEEVLAFVNDPDPNAYEKLVDRLLDSPHYGERMARHWLDLARYADSDGYEKDLPRPHAWRYREWVIQAFNRDLPYDRFTVQQIAGDLLPEGGLSAKVATGFHRNTLTNREGGIDREEDRVKQNVDRLNTTSTVFLGLTVACAQCHTHKYDPITQREYFQMYSFFDHALEEDVPASLPWQQTEYETRLAGWEKERETIQKEIEADRPRLLELLPAWEKEQSISEVEWTLLIPTSMNSIGGATFELLDDGAVRVGGENPLFDSYTLSYPTDLKEIVGFRLEVLTDESLPKTGPGRADHGNFLLSEIGIQARLKKNPKTVEKGVFASAYADHHEPNYPIERAFDGKSNTGWSIEAFRDPSLNTNRTAVFVLEETLGYAEGSILQVDMDFSHGNRNTLGKFRLYAAVGPKEHLTIPPQIPEILALTPEERTEEEVDRLLEYFGGQEPKAKELFDRLAAHDQAKPKPPDTLAQILVANPKPPTTHIHTRGDFLRPGDPVQPGTLAVLQPFQPAKPQPDRLDFANWVVDPRNPLTARVAVNRWWMYLFGRGIVNTPEDFGVQGERPSHPELLDWLAAEFVDSGWGIKDFIRLVVTSNTYRQASTLRSELHDRDPQNVWLARQNRFRVEAEILRDMSLSVSGLLVPKIGGPSIRPPLPDGVADLGYARSVKWKASEGEDKYRRGLYIFFQRTVPYPTLITFDCPDSNVTSARRSRSNTPLQALVLLNNVVFAECAQHFGHRLFSEGGSSVESKIRHGFLLAVGREPAPTEIEILTRLYSDYLAMHSAEGAAPQALLASLDVGEQDCVEAAAWISTARVILNLDEFVTRE